MLWMTGMNCASRGSVIPPTSEGVGMELWLLYSGMGGKRPADAVLAQGDVPPDWAGEGGIRTYTVREGCLTGPRGDACGVYLTISDESEQLNALQYIGMGEWVVVECGDWKMIPIENIVAAAQSSATKVAAVITEPSQLQGAAFALASGVDALVIPDDDDLWETAEFLAAKRLSDSSSYSETSAIVVPTSVDDSLEVTSVEPSGLGDRVCIDLVQMLELGEGLLIGSSASMLTLVHGETLPSEFVQPRPFRVNAGPVHSYVLMGDGDTKYLSELEAGDEVLVASADSCRVVAVGRLKIESRPLLLVRLQADSGETGQVFLQQAETVRLVSNLEKPVSVTSLKEGMRILGSICAQGRHLGRAITSSVEER